METTAVAKTYLDHEVELAYENIRAVQTAMRLGRDPTQDVTNLIMVIPSDILGEDKKNIAQLFKELLILFETVNNKKIPESNFKWSKRHITQWRNSNYNQERDMKYKQILNIIVNRIHDYRGKSAGSINMG